MKVFFALLLIIGYASAHPDQKAIIKNLQGKLEQDLQNMEQHTRGALIQIDVNIKKNLAIKNIFFAFTECVKDFSKDVTNMVKLVVTDIEHLLENIQTGINELKKAVTTVVPILEDLKKKLKEIIADVKLSMTTLLKKIVSRFFDCMKSIISAPKNTTIIIQATIHTEMTLVIIETQKYIATITNEIQDAFQKINEELDNSSPDDDDFICCENK